MNEYFKTTFKDEELYDVGFREMKKGSVWRLCMFGVLVMLITFI